MKPYNLIVYELKLAWCAPDSKPREKIKSRQEEGDEPWWKIERNQMMSKQVLNSGIHFKVQTPHIPKSKPVQAPNLSNYFL